MTSPFKPTAQQEAALEAFATGESIRLTAAAGSGKTSTLRLLSEVDPSRRGGYLAYNKQIAEEAGRAFPANVACRTTHSLAFASLDEGHKARLSAPKVWANQLAGRLGIQSSVSPARDIVLTKHDQARLALNMVDIFCASADKTLQTKHLVRSKMTGPLDHNQVRMLATHLLPYAKRAWADLVDPNGTKFNLSHDHYLKIYAMTEPVWKADFLLFDEAQDTSPVVAELVRLNQAAGKQIVAVGDPCQAIYGWRGAIDSMGMFTVQHDLMLSKSFRFGPRVAEEAQKWLDALGSDIEIEGNDALDSTVTNSDVSGYADVVLCRTNAGAMEVFLKLLDADRKAALPKAKELERLVDGAHDLRTGKKPKHPELALFSNWDHLCQTARDDNDPDLVRLVAAVDRFGTYRLKQMLDKAAPVGAADVLIATAHSAKGREWDTVQLHDDFRSFRRTENSVQLPVREEMMLNYVAVTRAKQTLGRGPLRTIDEFAYAD